MCYPHVHRNNSRFYYFFTLANIMLKYKNTGRISLVWQQFEELRKYIVFRYLEIVKNPLATNENLISIL